MTYETALTQNGAYAVEREGFTLGRFVTSGGSIRWSYVAPPWSNEASTIQTLLRNVPAATIRRLEGEVDMTRTTIIEETHVNETEGYWMGEPTRIALADTFLGEDATPGDVYRYALSEYGRCVSKVYVDAEGGPKAVGWVFQKRDRYEDTGETFLHETWITLLERYEEKVERDFVDVSR